MSYTVKLKDQTGSEVTYNSIEQVAIPKASGNGNAHFVAQYSVTKTVLSGITYVGGDSAAHGVDYMCYITATAVPDAITVTIAGNALAVGSDYAYTKLNDGTAIINIYGSKITGDITITASA